MTRFSNPSKPQSTGPSSYQRWQLFLPLPVLILFAISYVLLTNMTVISPQTLFQLGALDSSQLSISHWPRMFASLFLSATGPQWLGNFWSTWVLSDLLLMAGLKWRYQIGLFLLGGGLGNLAFAMMMRLMHINTVIVGASTGTAVLAAVLLVLMIETIVQRHPLQTWRHGFMAPNSETMRRPIIYLAFWLIVMSGLIGSPNQVTVETEYLHLWGLFFGLILFISYQVVSFLHSNRQKNK